MHNQLLEFLRDVAAALKDAPLTDDTVSALESTQETVREMFVRYDQPAPLGAEAVRDAMREALQLFFQSLELLLDAHETGTADQLTVAVAKAEEASDLLEQVEYLTQSL